VSESWLADEVLADAAFAEGTLATEAEKFGLGAAELAGDNLDRLASARVHLY